MGYTHQWRRQADIGRAAFSSALEDVKLILAKASEMGLRLAGPTGHGKPEITQQTIAFNGSAECGHRHRDLGKPWPSPEAEGVEAHEPYAPDDTPWYSGPYLKTRVCGGSCAGGAFVFDRRFIIRDWDRPENDQYFAYCETDFKPYDLIVTAILIRLKEHLGDEIVIWSDGLEAGFEDAKRLCRQLFGWSTKFALEQQGAEVI